MLRQTAIVMGAVLALLLLMMPDARSQQAGQTGYVGAWCISMEATRDLAKLAGASGDKGYTEAMRSIDLDCYDTRYHPVTPQFVTLVGIMFRLERADGMKFDFWKARDVKGKFGYTWFPVPASDGPRI